MKSIIPVFLFFGFIDCATAQIITPIVKSDFGVEADLQANYYENTIQNGNDDWFNNSTAANTGRGVIDTTGAADIIARYSTDPVSRQLPFYRTMSVPAYSVVNGRMWIDAVFIRDYHDNDSTVFSSGSKNGMNPKDWLCPVVQSVPDKNEILDMMVHVRRAGPDASDSLWLFGGLSIQNTNGDRYFDFEMYQTDIYYDRSALKFSGYGPDAGHTSWKFDAAGNIIAPGDIIFSADYGSSTLSSIAARIWVNKSALSVTPAAFSWSGTFDGASSGAQFGYAGIVPKSSGAFYTGTENTQSTWAGPFNLIYGSNQMATNYTPGQFMEFGVNLTKLGLDPVTLLGSNDCGMPFRRVLVKSRASTSFTAALKDFVGPFDFFQAPRVMMSADTSSLCGLVGTSQIDVINPNSTSLYSWSTPDGHIDSYNSPTSITVNTPGTYVVAQRLQSGCPVYATDTVVITSNPSCFILQNPADFKGRFSHNQVLLNWSTPSNKEINYFEIERATDGSDFSSLGRINPQATSGDMANYNLTDNVNLLTNPFMYYRLKTVGYNRQIAYSKIIKLYIGENQEETISISPNPVRDLMHVNIFSSNRGSGELSIYDVAGRCMMFLPVSIQKQNTVVEIKDFQSWPRGMYSVKLSLGNSLFIKRMVLIK